MSVTKGARETERRRKNESLALSFSRLRRQLPLGGSHGSVRFFPLCRRENKDKIQGSKPKVGTFSFCGSAARRHEPSSGRKVSRVSVTEGARGTEKQQKAEVFRRLNVNPSPASRELPLHKGAMGRYDFRLCAAEKAEAKIKVSKAKAAAKQKSRTLLQSPSATALSRREPLFVRIFSFVPQQTVLFGLCRGVFSRHSVWHPY